MQQFFLLLFHIKRLQMEKYKMAFILKDSSGGQTKIILILRVELFFTVLSVSVINTD